MKKSLSTLGTLLTVIMFICDAAEFLAIPAIIVLYGLFCGYPVEFYIVAIGAYLLLFALIELIAFLFSRLFGRKINSFMTKKLEKYFEKHEKEIDTFIEKCEPTLERIADTLTSENPDSDNKTEE